VGFTGIRAPKVELGVPASGKLVSEGFTWHTICCRVFEMKFPVISDGYP